MTFRDTFRSLLLTITLIAASSNLVIAQNQKPCEGPEYSLLDFWVGDWALTWGNNLKGTNKVHKAMDGCVVQENFNGNPGIPNYMGKSFSTYDKTDKTWKQVWIDNTGGWLDFTGKKVEEEVHFTRMISVKGVATIQRMRFYNITFRSFDWAWESSTNNGQTWKTNWAIHYDRVSNSAASKSE